MRRTGDKILNLGSEMAELRAKWQTLSIYEKFEQTVDHAPDCTRNSVRTIFLDVARGVLKHLCFMKRQVKLPAFPFLGPKARFVPRSPYDLRG
jgi:hypothetical protein